MATTCVHAAPAKKSIELADVLRQHGAAYAHTHRVNGFQWKIMRSIVQCRTPALGGHRDWCPQCGYERYVYHSCRNRHCPKCQTLAKAQWLEKRQNELLPVPYFHNVFTLPHELNGLVLFSERNRRALWNLLFRAASGTLLAFGRNNLGGTLGATLVLHTWDQQLKPHFHVHALVTGGALATDGSEWIAAGKNFLFSVKALSKVFRAKYLEGLSQLIEEKEIDLPPNLASAESQQKLKRTLSRKAWVVYSKAPFAGPQKLLDYLGRYTHRVAISNHRLLALENGEVEFSYRDRRDGDRRKTMRLPVDEFIGRFLTHALPSRFMRIRHYGLLGNRVKKQQLALCRQLLGVAPSEPTEPKTLEDWLLLWTGDDITKCPQCGHPALVSRVIPPLDTRYHSSNDPFW